ncbi:MAG: hypothetical protein ABH867_03645 [Patescibacteria group bacterium]|nr:hypothetical protein [Patescibacteria group bacterium]
MEKITKIFRFLKQYQLILLLVLIVIFMAAYRVLGSKQTEKETEEISPTPTPTTMPQAVSGGGRGMTEKVFVQDLLEKFPLTPALPYQGKDFAILYTEALSLKVTLNMPDTATNRQKVLDWIKEQGVDPQTHNISWE